VVFGCVFVIVVTVAIGMFVGAGLAVVMGLIVVFAAIVGFDTGVLIFCVMEGEAGVVTGEDGIGPFFAGDWEQPVNSPTLNNAVELRRMLSLSRMKVLFIMPFNPYM
ncbi:MAG: hypothetical protein JKY24_04230, partial [Pseudomonadales bacterium]|nr:hypothetical protein [Pseudomonadales bacterium]